MLLFEGKKFLFLPNRKSSSLSFLSQLIKSNGGTVIDNVGELDELMVTVINKSFVDADQRLTNTELFLKEFEMDPNVVWGFILREKPLCVVADCISEWLRLGRLTLASKYLITIKQEGPADRNRGHNGHVGGSEREGSNSEFGLESQSETDIGSQISLKEEHENVAWQPSLKNELENRPPSSPTATSSPITEDDMPKNQMLVKALGKLAKRYEIKGDQFRTRGYKLAKIGVEKYPHVICSGEQARRDIASVGSSIAKKIQIILETGSLPGLDESFELEKKLSYFTNCHDVGIYSAKRWNLLGLQSFADVSKKFPELFVRDWPILFGWSYYEDWLMKISREECEEILKVIRNNLLEIDPACHLELQGSYIRGAPECGDIDILFYKEGCDSTLELGKTMERLALLLYEKGYIQCFLHVTSKIRQVFGHQIKERVYKCNLKTPSHEEYPPVVDDSKKYFLGFKLQSEFKPHYVSGFASDSVSLEANDRFMSLSSSERPCRRVDFFCCRWSELGAARLQWTGPKEFNRWIRIKAAQKGMKLTQHGLYRGENFLLESFDEKRIFELLGEEFVGPDRNSIIKKRQRIDE